MNWLLAFIALILWLTRPKAPPEPPPPPPPTPGFQAKELTGGVGKWHFEEIQGNVVLDSSDFGNDGTITGGVKLVNALFRNGLDFNGAGAVTVSHSPTLDLGANFTISAFVLFRDFASYPRIVQKGNRETTSVAYAMDVSNASGFQGGANFPQVNFRVYQGGQLFHVFGSPQIAVQTFYHIGAVKQGSQLRVYLDGVQVGSAPCQAGPVNVVTEPLNIGHSPNNTDGELDGILEDLQIYARAATHAEMALLATRA